MIPLHEAYAILDRSLAGLRLESETLPVRLAAGRVVQEDQLSRLSLPPFDKSAMDGYAILEEDVRDSYRLVETVAAGQAGKANLVAGTTVKVMTGAPVPAGTGRVVMQEFARESQGTVHIERHGGPANICRRAEDVREGDVVMEAGTRLGPLQIASLIACGIDSVQVARRARLAVLSTGDEIVDSADQLGPGKIMNSNGPMLALLAEAFGLDVVGMSTVADDPGSTTHAVHDALERADVVVLSGGVSVGVFDFVLEAFSRVGLDVRFSRLAVKPGKPTVFGQRGSRLAFGLPGNPVSSYLMFHLFVLRAVARLTGSQPPMREFTLRLGHDHARRKLERLEYVPCRLRPDGTLETIDFHGSGHLAAMMQADGFFQVPAGVAEFEAGHEVVFSPLPRGFP